MAEIETILLLDADALAAGERYSTEHGTSISRLVSDFLRRLPAGELNEDELSPNVRRLIGIATGGRPGGDADVAEYHEYLARKYGVE